MEEADGANISRSYFYHDKGFIFIAYVYVTANP